MCVVWMHTCYTALGGVPLMGVIDWELGLNETGISTQVIHANYIEIDQHFVIYVC